jgi:uncharacterized protein YqjF (DUF2071 family)
MLRRHPLAMQTTFAHSLMLTYAFAPELLRPMLPPGLSLDTYQAPDGREHGFVAVGVLSARRLRPAGLPAALGGNCLLTGYRIITRFPTPEGKTMRGLYIIRSDTDRRMVRTGGNLLTRYNYAYARIRMYVHDSRLTASVESGDGRGDLEVVADLAAESALPVGTPFSGLTAARRFAGPLPYTFDYERATDSIVVVKASRGQWWPRPVPVDVRRLTFFDHGDFAGTKPVLANAFHVADVDYSWERGSLRTLEGALR